ncbi:MAG: Gfo/Idh/MocA family oxidoreductase [candidate division Zixibacteria bacterium]|nr:Gfo/Idh/MocA family oxidoreductase [candidate division Zixibacteria bacterium]
MYQAVIIGCGGIGGLADAPGEKNIISHAYAYSSHDSFELIAGCDINPDNLARFKTKWGNKLRLYSDYNELINKESFEIVSVCTSTTTHANIISKLLTKDTIRLIICEKPLVASLDELIQLKNNLNKLPDKKLLINFSRRYDPGFQELSKRVINNELGQPQSFNGTFCKGLYHNGCHMLELIEFLIGDLKSISAITNKIADDDIYGIYSVETTDCIGTMVNFEQKKYSIFELDIYFEKGRVRITEGGHRLEIFRPAESKIYAGYTELYPDEIIEDSFYKRSYHIIEAARSYLEEDSIDGRKVFYKHLELSEKMLIIKEKFISNIKTVTFK